MLVVEGEGGEGGGAAPGERPPQLLLESRLCNNTTLQARPQPQSISLNNKDIAQWTSSSWTFDQLLKDGSFYWFRVFAHLQNTPTPSGGGRWLSSDLRTFWLDQLDCHLQLQLQLRQPTIIKTKTFSVRKRTRVWPSQEFQLIFMKWLALTQISRNKLI